MNYRDFKHINLTNNEKILLDEIITLSLKTGYCFKSNKKLAQDYGVSVRTIQRWLEGLSKKNCIEVKIENDYNRKIYVKLLEADNKKVNINGDDNNDIPERQECHTPMTYETGGNDNIVDNKLLIQDISKNNKSVHQADRQNIAINSTFKDIINNIGYDEIVNDDVNKDLLKIIIDTLYDTVVNMSGIRVNNVKIAYPQVRERYLLLRKDHILRLIQDIKNQNIKQPVKYMQAALYNAPMESTIRTYTNSSKKNHDPSDCPEHIGFKSFEDLEKAIFNK